MTIHTTEDYQEHVVIPYLDSLIENINQRFSDKAVKLLVATSISNPPELSTGYSLSSYGVQQIKNLTDFYGTDASVDYVGITYTSPPLLAHDELLSEYKVFRRAPHKEKELLMSSESHKVSQPPSLQDVLITMQATEAYRAIFPHTYTLIHIPLTLPGGTAMVEQSFSEMKMIKTRLRNRLSDCNLERLMKIADEGPQIGSVPFEEILEVFKMKNRRIEL